MFHTYCFFDVIENFIQKFCCNFKTWKQNKKIVVVYGVPDKAFGTFSFLFFVFSYWKKKMDRFWVPFNSPFLGPCMLWTSVSVIVTLVQHLTPADKRSCYELLFPYYLMFCIFQWKSYNTILTLSIIHNTTNYLFGFSVLINVNIYIRKTINEFICFWKPASFHGNP